jgi:hypothetical protein
VSEWNVPDWHDPTQYPPRRWTQDKLFRRCPLLRLWAWEFLRRNPEYRALWREHIAPFYKTAFSSQDIGVPVKKQAVLVHRFGLDWFPPSPNDDRPPSFIGTGLCWTEGNRVSSPFQPNPDDPIEVRMAETREAGMLLYPGQIAVIFDLTRPISRQMAAAKKLFTEQRDQARLPARRNRIELFALYLRVLDGVDAGAKHTEIGAVLFEKKSNDERLITVRDYLAAATRLRDKDYLFIATGAAAD